MNVLCLLCFFALQRYIIIEKYKAIFENFCPDCHFYFLSILY